MIRNNRGTTIVELTIAMLVGSVVISTVYQTHRYISESADRETTKAIFEREICTISQLFEKDVRMAGLGLPDNGIDLQLTGGKSDELSIYTNENRILSSLIRSASTADSCLLIQDASGMNAKGWVCISGTSDTVYKEILRIGDAAAGPDTIYMGEKLGAGPFAANSQVYFAKRIQYSVVTFPDTQFLRRVNGLETPLSAIIDSLKINLRNASGTNVNNNPASAVFLSVLYGGKVGSGKNSSFLAESTEVNIRK